MRYAVLLTALVLCVSSSRAAPPDGGEFFEKEVRPLLVEKCQQCHSEQKARGGLRLTSREAVLKGGDSGPAAVSGKPDKSLLIHAIRYVDTPVMPPKEKLGAAQITTLTRWVELGLPWPEGSKPVQSGGKFEITDEQRRFWSFQPVRSPRPPEIKETRWPRSDLDRFVLAGLEKKGLRPVEAADRRTLIRRATFDLTGLPPTPQEVEEFLKDQSTEAFAKVVDRLLTSPAYGERWGRHWLDVVRYADSHDARGIGGEMDIREAWRYRDWVVEAFNRDLPYDRFVQEQIAGDVLPRREGYSRDGVVATGLLAIGNWGGGDADKEKLLTDIADDQIDVVARSFLGLTMACARCHDHKFDPISMADYYGLAGIFFSTHILPNVGPKTNGPPILRIPLVSPEETARRRRQAEELKQKELALQQESRKAHESFARAEAGRVADYLLAAQEIADNGGDVEQLARSRKLAGFALRNWVEWLGGPDYPRMTQPLRDVLNARGIHGWKGKTDTPSMLTNTTNEAVKLLTFTLPARSVSVHPGPTSGVAVAWRSPITGTLRISGKVSDADPVCGDGIAWKIELRRGAVRRELAGGDIANGAAQGFGAKALEAVDVKVGDILELLVVPKGSHSCDTTTVEWTLRLADGSKEWSLAADLVNDPLAGNPHSDRHGNKDVWSFHDLAGGRRLPAEAAAELAAWQKLAASEKNAEKRRAAALEFQKRFKVAEEQGPFRPRTPADENSLSEETRSQLAKLRTEVESLRKTEPIELAHGAQEGGVPGSPHAGVHDVRIHVRGRYDRLGEMVPRRFPEVLAGTKQTPIKEGSGRLELARWLSSKDNPLTARVMVNRIWQFHFGEGLVRTPSNFGKLGQAPTHPELLDWLAAKFVEDGWSIKQMHRRLMLSALYQSSSVPSAELLKVDPDNLLWGRMNRRRLEAEPLRDSLLAASGKLDLSRGGPAVRNLDSTRRTLYLMTIRSDRSGYASLFDSADPTAPVEKRVVSTVAPQALFLLNHPFAATQARELARRLLAEKIDDTARVERVYQLLFGRPPRPEEVKLGLQFVSGGKPEQVWGEYCHVLLCTNEFIYVD